MRTWNITTLAAALLLAATGVAQPWPTMPRALRKGDRVAVVSPSSSPSQKTVDAGCRVLRAWGYEPVVAPHATDDHHGFAGTADARAADLLWALRDSTVSAIMCTRGGDGAVQLLPYISSDDMRRHPKWLIGFSDITALHSAMVSAGVMTIHGSMLHAISAQGGTDSVSVILHSVLEGHLPTYRIGAHPLNQPGTAEGMLVGGNLAVFNDLAGSPYDFLQGSHDIILFIEDTDEPMTKVDRMWHHIVVRGLLPRIKGVIVGHFTDYKHPENGFDDMNAMLHEYLQHLGVPVCYAFPVGHKRPNLPMIEGCRIRLTVTADSTTLQFLKEAGR